MNKTSSKILIYAVIFLAVLNIATLATIGYHIYQTKASDNFQPNKGITNEDDAQNYNGRYFRDRLQLTQEQMDSFRVVNYEFRTKAGKINSLLNTIRQKMLTEMSKNTADTIKLNALSDSIGQLHKTLKICSYQYYSGIKNICTPEQTTELNNIFQEFFVGYELHHNHQNTGRNRKGRR